MENIFSQQENFNYLLISTQNTPKERLSLLAPLCVGCSNEGGVEVYYAIIAT